MNIDTSWLKDFVALANVRNFSKAAQLRHITQPAFGRRIKALETAVNQILIDRNTNPISLTPAGQQFHVVARNVLSQITDGIEQLNDAHHSTFNPVNIASPHSLSSPTLINLLDSIQTVDAPLPYSVDILRVEEGIHALKEGQCDYLLAFDHIALLQPPFQNLLLGKGQYLLVSAQKNGAPIYSLDDPMIPYLRYTDDSYSARLLEQHQADLPTNFSPVFQSSMCQLHKEMALLGKGVAWLPDVLIYQELKDEQLIPLNAEQYHLPFQVRLYRYGAPLSKDAEKLWLRLSEKYARHTFCQPYNPSLDTQ